MSIETQVIANESTIFNASLLLARVKNLLQNLKLDSLDELESTYYI